MIDKRTQRDAIQGVEGKSLKILWIPHTSWHIPQRAHLFCQVLAERHEVHVTDWVADFYNLQDYISTRYLKNFFYRRKRESNLTVHGIPRISPALFFPTIRRINSHLYSQWVRRIIRYHAIDAVVGTFVLPPPQAPRLIFDLFDENVAYWRSYGLMKDYAEEIERNEIDYMDSADAIVAASEVLTKKIRSLTNKPIHFIPNGVDLKNFRGTSEAHQRVKRVVSRSIIGILGNHDRAAELHKVIDAVHLLSKSRLVFIIAGRGKAIPEIRSRIRREKLKNIKFLPQVPLSSAPRVVSSFDVGLCPYLKSGGADASSPMRLLMYSAAGLPTVCTELTEIRNMDFPNVIMVRDDHRALADGILHGLTLPRLSPKKIQKYDIYKLAIRYEKVLEGKERSETREEV